MDRTRIRWRNVGRLAGGLGAGALLLVVVPALLEPADPAPLPADVGLDPAPASGYADLAVARREGRPARRRPERPAAADGPDSRARPPAGPRPDPRRARRDRHSIPSPAGDAPEGAAAAAPGTVPPAPAPAPTAPPAPPPVATPPPPAATAPPSPAPTSPPEPAGDRDEHEPPPPPSPSAFGFER